MNILRRIGIVSAFLALAMAANAQRVAVSTNGLYWLAGAPNASVQLRMSHDIYLSLDVAGRPNVYKMGFERLKFFAFHPEVRWYLKHQGMQGHYVGPMALYSTYTGAWNKHDRDGVPNVADVHKGDLMALGVVYGYDWMLGKRWNIGVSAGIGAMFLRDHKNYSGDIQRHFAPAPLKLGVNFTYMIR